MHKKVYPVLLLLAFLVAPRLISAQANDECSGATLIPDATEFCSDPLSEDNTNATPSPQIQPNCFFAGAAHDLWYCFTAVEGDMVFSVTVGTMFLPQIALYSGDCNNLNEIACITDGVGAASTSLVFYGLVTGQKYYVRVDASFPGTFQYCIRNTPHDPLLSGDCPTAPIVCSSELPLHLGPVFGGGVTTNEMFDALCFQGLAGETSASWITFTAASNSKLEFTLLPDNPADDLDFVLYRLPNGPGDCTGRIVERCMAAGDFAFPSPCMGPTGLNSTATDIAQPPGCAVGQDNFLRYLNMMGGATYALVVNNFTTDGAGFSIEWGPQSKFKGPTAKFLTDEPDQKICLGEELILTDSSYYVDGTITDWHWDLGLDALPYDTTSQGPITAQYGTVGPKQIILMVESAEGCVGYDTAFVIVQVCCIVESSVSVQPGCPDDPDATVTLSIQNAVAPYDIQWSSGQTDTTSVRLPTGSYSVTVEDANGCVDSVSFEVVTPLNVSALFPPDTLILLGGTATLGITAQPNDSLIVWWIANGDTLTGTTVMVSPEDSTTYFVVVNNAGCIFTDSVTVLVREKLFKAPNAFTPNGDGSNDTFGPVLFGGELVQMEVWSRWGEKIFDANAFGYNTWDGTINGSPGPSDVYVFRIKIRFNDGTEEMETGDVTLLR